MDDFVIGANIHLKIKRRIFSASIAAVLCGSVLCVGGFAEEPSAAVVDEESYVLPTLPDGMLEEYYNERISSDSNYGISVASETDDDTDYEAVYSKYMYFYNDEATQETFDAADKIIAMTDDSWTDLEKALFVNDYLCATCEYDKSKVGNNAYYLLVEKKAVCLGYAEAYCLILNRMGIDCRIISSDELNHAWNLVRIDGNWYHVDVTWNDPTYDSYDFGAGHSRHKYFMLSDSKIRELDQDQTINHDTDDWEATMEGGISLDGYAISTKYDDYFWSDVDYAISIYNGCYYYTGDSGIICRTASGSESTIVDMSSTKWYVKDSSYTYWGGNYSGCSIYNGKLYYNTPSAIMSCNLDGSNVKTIYTISDDESEIGSIYSSFIDDDILYYVLTDNPYSNTKEEKCIIMYDIKPKNVKASAGDKNIMLTWSAVKNASQYRIQQLKNSVWTTIAFPSTTSYTATGLSNGTGYSYRVLAKVNDTWSAASAAVKATPYSTVPKNVKATSGDKKITVTWNKVNGATQYRIQQLKNSVWTTISYPSTNSFTATGLTNGTSYSYRVLTKVNNVWSAASSAVTSIPVSTPTNVKAAAGDKSVTVSWSKASGATQYRIQQLKNSVWTTVAFTSGTKYTATGLTNGTSYSFRVLAGKNNIWGNVSAAVTSIPVATPTNVKATAGNKTVMVTWSKASGATNYRIQQLKNSVWTTVAFTSSTKYTATGLTNGTKYSFRVLEGANGTWGTASASASATPYNTTPTGLKATAGSRKVTLSWNAVNNATQYRVQQLIDSVWTSISYPTATSYTVTGLTKGKSYSFRVLSKVNGTWSTASSAVKAKAK